MRSTITSKLSLLLLALSCLCLTASGTARIAVLSQATESETNSPVEAKEVCHHKIEARRLSLKMQPRVQHFAPTLDEACPLAPARDLVRPRPRQSVPPPLRAPPLA